jgi:peptidoglycan-associated lipoprotein
MNHVRRIAGLTTAMLSVLMVDACHKKPAPAPVPATQPPNADSIRRAQEEAARRAAEEAARRRAADSAAAAEAAARDAAAKAAGLRTTLTQMVHFEFDQSDLRAEDRAILDAKVPIMQANSNVTIRISGHADERGSDEYNLALGQRRAEAVVKSLTLLGADPTQLEAVSFGKERPAVQGENEEAWAKNRRAELASR